MRLKLWIGNIAPGTNDEELREFVGRYGIETVASIQHVDDGSRPAAILEVAATPDQLRQVSQRLNGMYWKGNSLLVQPLTR